MLGLRPLTQKTSEYKEEEHYQRLRERWSFLKMFYRVLTILFIIGVLAFTYFLAYYIFYPAPQVDSLVTSIQRIERSRADDNHLPQLPSKTSDVPGGISVSASQASRANYAEHSAGSGQVTPNAPKSQPQQPVAASQPAASSHPSIPSGDNLTFGVQFDNFSNSVYINQAQTTLYQDKTATAVFYPPVYTWEDANGTISSATENSFKEPTFNPFKGPYNDTRCIGSNCLVQKGNDLYYNGQKLLLPKDLQSSDLKALSIDSLSTRWVVGATLQNSSGYIGLAYYFNGQKFTQINMPKEVRSSYFGLWGFGGSDNDFLMIYGAYEGIAYHVSNGRFTDISTFFSYRAMNNIGYRPEIVRAASNSDINWYIYSATSGRPWFFKLWQNGTSKIVGEVFFNNIFGSSVKSAAFKLVNANTDQITLLAKLADSQKTGFVYKLFVDKGFDNTKAGVLISNPLENTMLPYNITIHKIYNVELGIDSGSQSNTQFLFSHDGQDWQSLIGKARTNFVSPATPIYLKVVLPAENNRFYSPYLGSMLFSYYWEKSS